MAKEAKRGRRAGVKQYPSLERQGKLLRKCIERSLEKVIKEYAESVSDRRGVFTKEQSERLYQELNKVRVPHLMLAIQSSTVFNRELFLSGDVLNEVEHYDLAEYHIQEAKRLKKERKKGGKPQPPTPPPLFQTRAPQWESDLELEISQDPIAGVVPAGTSAIRPVQELETPLTSASKIQTDDKSQASLVDVSEKSSISESEKVLANASETDN